LLFDKGFGVNASSLVSALCSTSALSRPRLAGHGSQWLSDECVITEPYRNAFGQSPLLAPYPIKVYHWFLSFHW